MYITSEHWHVTLICDKLWNNSDKYFSRYTSYENCRFQRDCSLFRGKKAVGRALHNNEWHETRLPSGSPGRQAAPSRSVLWWDILRCCWWDGCCVSLSGSLATRSSTSPHELAEPESLRNACPSVFAWNGDAAGKPVGVPGKLLAETLARLAVLSTTACHVVADDVSSAVSLPIDWTARWLVLFTSYPPFDTIPAPSSDAILIPWATSRTRRYYAVVDWRLRLPATMRADHYSPCQHRQVGVRPVGGTVLSVLTRDIFIRRNLRSPNLVFRETFRFPRRVDHTGETPTTRGVRTRDAHSTHVRLIFASVEYTWNIRMYSAKK